MPSRPWTKLERRKSALPTHTSFIVALWCVVIAGSAGAQTCSTFGQPCTTNAACADADECNGTEFCAGLIPLRFCACASSLPCDDNNPCTRDTCLATPRGVICDHLSGGCNDGNYCNGLETCAARAFSCDPGTPPCESPLMCDEAGDRCVECLVNEDCSDNLPCTSDACSDGTCQNPWCDSLFCNGRELCRLNGCVPAVSPCINLVTCDEKVLSCHECETDIDCSNKNNCSSNVCDPDWHTCRTKPCRLTIESPAEGSTYEVGDLVDVSGSGPRGLDVCLVLDESGSIDNTEFELLKVFAYSLVNALPDFRFDNTGTKAGIVQFSSQSRRILDLNNNRQSVLNVINSLQSIGGSTCIGCGIDDGTDNINMNGRAGATKVIFLVTDGQNNVPPDDPSAHLGGALEAARVYEHVIFAIGVGDGVSMQDMQQIATPLVGRQTAFYAPQFGSLVTLVNDIILNLFPLNVAHVDLVLPDNSSGGAIVDPAGHWTYSNWIMLPGENVFTATIDTLYGSQSETLTLIGMFPCQATCGDVNGDAVVNLRDGAVMQRCFGGPQYTGEECACADLDGTIEIDSSDWAAFIGSWESPTLDQPPNCVMP